MIAFLWRLVRRHVYSVEQYHALAWNEMTLAEAERLMFVNTLITGYDEDPVEVEDED